MGGIEYFKFGVGAREEEREEAGWSEATNGRAPAS